MAVVGAKAVLRGSHHNMLGRQSLKVASNAPQCVGPSTPTNPAVHCKSYWQLLQIYIVHYLEMDIKHIFSNYCKDPPYTPTLYRPLIT